MRTATIPARNLAKGNMVVRGGTAREVVFTMVSADGKHVGIRLAGQSNLITLDPNESIEIQVTDYEF